MTPPASFTEREDHLRQRAARPWFEDEDVATCIAEIDRLTCDTAGCREPRGHTWSGQVGIQHVPYPPERSAGAAPLDERERLLEKARRLGGGVSAACSRTPSGEPWTR